MKIYQQFTNVLTPHKLAVRSNTVITGYSILYNKIHQTRPRR